MSSKPKRELAGFSATLDDSFDMHDASEPDGPAQQINTMSNAVTPLNNTVNVFQPYSRGSGLDGCQSGFNTDELYIDNANKKDFSDGAMVASPTFNILGQSGDTGDNYCFQSTYAQPTDLSPSKEFSLIEQHDELSLTKGSADCPTSALFPQDSSPGKIQREISFHSKSSDLFSERQRALQNNVDDQRRTRQVSSITEQTNLSSTQHSDD